MSRSFTGLRIGSLPFITDGPARPQPSRNRVWRAFENRHAATDLADAFAQQRQNGRAFFHSRREMVRIAGEANWRMARHQPFDELRMTFVEIHAVGGDIPSELDCHIGP